MLKVLNVNVVVIELKKFRRYQIVMTSYNIIGESPPSAPVEVFVGEAGRWTFQRAVSLVKSHVTLMHKSPFLIVDPIFLKKGKSKLFY